MGNNCIKTQTNEEQRKNVPKELDFICLVNEIHNNTMLDKDSSTIVSLYINNFCLKCMKRKAKQSVPELFNCIVCNESLCTNCNEFYALPKLNFAFVFNILNLIQQDITILSLHSSDSFPYNYLVLYLDSSKIIVSGKNDERTNLIYNIEKQYFCSSCKFNKKIISEQISKFQIHNFFNRIIIVHNTDNFVCVFQKE